MADEIFFRGGVCIGCNSSGDLFFGRENMGVVILNSVTCVTVSGD